jgi:hypothetical protein
MGLIATGSSPPLPAFAVPDKRGWLLIPAPRGLLKPAPDLVWAVRMLSIERAALEHALDRLRHVEPAAAHRRVERHDPMRVQPPHQLGRLVASDTGSGRWTRIEDSWVVDQRVGWWAMSGGGEPWRGLLII